MGMEVLTYWESIYSNHHFEKNQNHSTLEIPNVPYELLGNLGNANLATV